MADRTFLAWPFFEGAHRSLAQDIASWAKANVDHASQGDEDTACRTLVRAMGDAGWLRYAVAAPHGHHERLDVRSLCLIRDALAQQSGLADFAFAMQGLGSGPISLFGARGTRDHYLPAVASGEAIAAFALSEEDAGSNVAALEASAKKDGSDYVLNGSKTWISNAGIADFYVVFARTGEGPGAKGLSAFVVDADTHGVVVTERIEVTSPHPLGTVTFSDCRLPAANRLGGGGDGFKIAMATLDVFRSTVGAAALGFARRALDESVARAKSRHVFDQALADFQMTQQKIADMTAEVEASALMVYRAAWQKDSGATRIRREAALAKLYATEAAQRVIDQAVQIHGGSGVVANSVVERLYRDIRPLRIYEGTSEIQKLIIAREMLKEDG